ncbi:MAG: hypothetical protein H6559_09985 [Lewinellaceae bacterium]|nr:hypothetical protein [Lewinellaceae bacterium]
MAGIGFFDLNIPKTDDFNKWADVVEIFCLVLEEGGITKDELFDRIFDENAGDIGESIQHFQENEFFEEDEDTLLLPSPDDISTNTESRERDILKSKIDELFLFLESRCLFYQEHYPFSLATGNQLKLKEELTVSNELYLSLLICSNLDIAKGYLHDLTKEFERISLSTLKSVFGATFQVEYFGAILKDVHTRFDKNKLKDRLVQLRESLKLNFNPNFNLDNEISSQNTGDYGLDIIAWHEFGDGNSNTFLYFIQCACGKEWVEKQLESSALRWENIFIFTNKPVSIILIPKSLRNNRNQWESALIFRGSVIIDRRRIVQSLSGKEDFKLHAALRGILKEIQENKISYFD